MHHETCEHGILPLPKCRYGSEVSGGTLETLKYRFCDQKISILGPGLIEKIFERFAEGMFAPWLVSSRCSLNHAVQAENVELHMVMPGSGGLIRGLVSESGGLLD